MKPIILIVSFIFLYLSIFAQSSDSLSLKYCYDVATKNYPILKQKGILVETLNLKLKNYNTNYLPKLDINGQASYQSDVTKVDIASPTVEFPIVVPPDLMPVIKMPKIDAPSKDQYRISLDVSQMIWDGGATKAQKNLERVGLTADTMKVTVDLYQIKDRINQLYFSILLLQEKDKLANIIKSELTDRIKSIESGVKNGVTLASNLDALKAEVIKIDQQKIEIKYSRIAAYKMLSELTGETILDNQPLQMLVFNINNDVNTSNRPEYLLFELQAKRIDATQTLLTKKYYPKLYGFAQLGYGNPGLNMYNQNFDSFYIVGAKLNWNLWDWRQTNREIKILNLQKDIISTQKETLDKNLNISSQNDLANIDKYEELMKMDIDIISLRESITKRSASQMQNGVITSTEYLSDLNNETQAKLNLNTHRLQLIFSKLNYLTI